MPKVLRIVSPTSPAPPEPKSFESCHKALAITEILELVLLQLPIPQLLLCAPLVSTTWNNTILESPKLQQALFFKPVPIAPVKICGGQHFKRWAQSDTDNHRYTVFANPFYFRHSGRFCKRVPLRDSEKFDRPEASWRRMLVSQPPIQEWGAPERDMGFRNDCGLKMGDGTIKIEDFSLRKYVQGFELDRVGGSAMWIEVKVGADVMKAVRNAPDWAILDG